MFQHLSHRQVVHEVCADAEVKIVYAVNPNMPSQLYEVDVFMFFLKDLEAVSNNFYHDLWQVARLHTPKVTAQLVHHSSNPAGACT